jgi:hypothetical protein
MVLSWKVIFICFWMENIVFSFILSLSMLTNIFLLLLFSPSISLLLLTSPLHQNYFLTWHASRLCFSSSLKLGVLFDSSFLPFKSGFKVRVLIKLEVEACFGVRYGFFMVKETKRKMIED